MPNEEVIKDILWTFYYTKSRQTPDYINNYGIID